MNINNFDLWQKEVDQTYDKIRRHKQPYSVPVSGLEIIVLPNVFSPAYFTDSEWFARRLPMIVNSKSLLEIGTGTGIIALFAALCGSKVVATDINPDAVANAKINFRRYHLNVPVLEGNIYDPLDRNSKFDFIFWNHPFNKGDNPDEEMLLRSGFDYQYQGLEQYVAGARMHLSKGGILLLGSSDFADTPEINRIAEANGFKISILMRDKVISSQDSKLISEYRICHLKDSQ